jgi:hypothetical protein
MPPPSLSQMSHFFIFTFRIYVLPILPILTIQDIYSLLEKYHSSRLTTIEQACFTLIVETGSLISYLTQQHNAKQALDQLRSSNFANAARCIRIEQSYNLNYVRACLLMSFFLRQAAQSDEHYLHCAATGMKILSRDSEFLRDHNESLSLIWLSLTCLALYVYPLKIVCFC